MSESASFLARRIDTGSLPLAVADLVAILVVVALGMVRHGTLTGVSPLLVTAAPFLLGWALASVPVGAYSPGAGESAKAAIPLAIRAWIPAVVVGILVRGAAFATFDVGLAIFGAVILVVGALSLGAFRWLYFAVLG